MTFLLLGGFILIIVLIIIIKDYLSNPFEYPHVTVNFDISGKRQPVYEDYVDEWVNGLAGRRYGIKNEFDKVLNKWDSDCNYYLGHCLLWRSHKEELYKTMRNEVVQYDYKMFEFIFSRNQTRYRQQNYKKYAYTVQNIVYVHRLSLEDLLGIGGELERINYETTRRKWDTKNQRSLMTKKLKDKIKKRDHYTCQMCGKYMPDEVGLHIDHIIPIKEGGKSVESNLQVLCDKCNCSKGKKLL
ncbi:MAG: HNH endonuclease [Ruminococcus sp.]|nr:HNH endonuclease [Ruminococcus sp.]